MSCAAHVRVVMAGIFQARALVVFQLEKRFFWLGVCLLALDFGKIAQFYCSKAYLCLLMSTEAQLFFLNVSKG